MAGITHNSFRVAQRIEARGVRVEAEVRAALSDQADMMARAVRRRAPSWRSILLQSINVAVTGEYSREISVGVNYGAYVEHGRPPGKGLPHYDSPEAASLIAWLEKKAGGPATRKSEKESHEKALRDIYVGWSRKVKRSGIEAKPFVKPAFEERVNGVALALRKAVAKGLAGDGATA